MRNAFVNELVQLARSNPRIMLIVGDLGFSVVEPFANEFPERFVNAGVAEQNMMGMAAGLASEGFHVFAYSIANFPTFRCAEQIRNDIAYHNYPVTVVSVGGGLAYGALGYSHHAVQDYALMRIFPNMQILAPGDPLEVRSCMRYLSAHPVPSYLRLGKAGEPTFHNEAPILKPGAWVQIRKGTSDKCFLTTGATLELAVNWTKTECYRDYSVYSLPVWGMESKSAQIAQVTRFSHVHTVEDHLRDAGFGSWLVESVLDHPKLLSRIEVTALNPVVCGMVGAQATLNAAGGLE